MDWTLVDDDPLGFLVSPQASKEFLEEVWETKPHVFKATPERKAFFQGLVTFKQLRSLATEKEGEGDPLLFGVDVNAARYVDGARETPNGDVADAETLKDLFVREGCTIQLHQPQRFVDDLWRLMAAMERQLGCLVGCNAYLTPKHTQGLAPHWDDVEIFVIQTEGSKRWSVYRPSEGPCAHSALANYCSGDLAEEGLGAPLMEFILEAGDVLYMPRGTIHQARALTAHSSHLTISTYQRWAWGDLMQYTVGVVLANPQLQPALPAPLRAGLTHRWLEAAGFCCSDMPQLGPPSVAGCGKSGSGKGQKAGASGDVKAVGAEGQRVLARAQLVSELATAFRSLADWLEAGAGEGETVPAGERALLAASCTMAEDFMSNRLPPHPEQLPDPGPEPSGDEDVVACRGQGLFLLVPLAPDDHPDGGSDSDSDEQGSGEEEEEEGPHGGASAGGGAGATKWVRLLSSLENDREGHMMSGGEGEGPHGEEEGVCCEVPGCTEDHHHHHHHELEHSHGSSGDEGEKGAQGGASGSKRESEEGAGAGATAAATAGRVADSTKRRGRGTGQKRKEREGAEGSDGEEDAEIESGAEIEDVSLDALMEEGGCGSGSGEGEEEGGAQEDMVLPIALAPALLQLLATDARAGHGMRVGELMAGGAEVRRDMAAALWGSGVLCTLSRAAAGAAAAAAPKEENGADRAEAKEGKGRMKKDKEAGRPGRRGSSGGEREKGSGGKKAVA